MVMMMSNNDDDGDTMSLFNWEIVHWNFSNLDDVQMQLF